MTTMRMSPGVFLHDLETENPKVTYSTAEPGLPISLADAKTVTESDATQLDSDSFGSDSPLRDQLQAGSPTHVSGYHLATRDHPFLDMSTGLDARIEDARIMAQYLAEADEYPPIHTDVPHPGATTALPRATDLGLDELRVRDECKFALILGGTFGVTGHQVEYYDPVSGYHQVELIRKSIPSGGSRHPTECFLEILRAPGDPQPGWYHFATRTNALTQTKPLSPDPVLTARAEESKADFVIVTHLHTVVRRAMFRYRDPRSMRALLVDAGHADGQLEALARYCNWSYESRLSIDTRFGELDHPLNGTTSPKLISGLLEGWAVS